MSLCSVQVKDTEYRTENRTCLSPVIIWVGGEGGGVGGGGGREGGGDMVSRGRVGMWVRGGRGRGRGSKWC